MKRELDSRHDAREREIDSNLDQRLRYQSHDVAKMPIEQVDAELRANGIDPQRTIEIVEERLARRQRELGAIPAPAEVIGRELDEADDLPLGEQQDFYDDVLAGIDRIVQDNGVIDPSLSTLLIRRIAARHAFRTRQAVLSLARRGWYVDPRVSQERLAAILDIFESRKSRRADRELILHYEKMLQTIVTEFAKKFPAREKLVRSAIWAHRRKKYALSVPVLLSQADGIAQELLSTSLFTRRNGLPRLAETVRRVTPFTAALAAALTVPNPITASRTERETLPTKELNRHSAIHGEDTKYGSRLNGCKALSVLWYVTWIIPICSVEHEPA